MNSYLDEQLHQRKSSLNSLGRMKRQASREFEQTKNQQNVLNRQQSNQYLKSQQKSISKSNFNDSMNPTQRQDRTTSMRGQQRTSSIKKNNPRLRDEESSDYIRNLYKKYLGKQNKQPFDKLNAYTERKLRTTESKQLIATNTTAKDMTRRTLFADNECNQTPNYNYAKKQPIKTQQLQPSHLTLMKKEKSKISTALSKPNQSCETPYQKSTYLQNNSKSIFQSNKKDVNSKKQDKKNYQKQCESKKSNKNCKSKAKFQKNQPEQQSKSIVIKRSQSTQLKSQKTNFQSNKRQQKQRGIQTSMSHTQINKFKDTKLSQSTNVHPHRESYCQFDTQQQIQNNNQIQSLVIDKNYQVLIERRQSTAAQSRSSQNIRNQQHQSIKSGDIYSKYVDDLQTLGMIVGKQSSLFLTLQKINKVKNKIKGANMSKLTNKSIEQKDLRYQHRLSHRIMF